MSVHYNGKNLTSRAQNLELRDAQTAELALEMPLCDRLRMKPRTKKLAGADVDKTIDSEAFMSLRKCLQPSDAERAKQECFVSSSE